MVATSLQLLSKASGVGSKSELPTVAPPTTTSASGRVLQPRVEAKSDVNFVVADERLSDYDSFSSGDGHDVEEQDESPLHTGDSDDNVLFRHRHCPEGRRIHRVAPDRERGAQQIG
jgi:hypothetical protein